MSPIVEDDDELPHRFESYQYRCNGDHHWEYVAQACIRAWRLNVDALLEDADETGFGEGPCRQILNQHGSERLPATPPSGGHVAQDPAVTDVTEVVALHVLDNLEDGIRFPYPRVLHKEPGTQHLGIDLIGYKIVNGEAILYVVEVMASAEDGSPPSTVYDHRNQLEGRLDNEERDELIQNLRIVHVEADEEHRVILNDVITKLLDEEHDIQPEDIRAAPVLVRRAGEFASSDWRPFKDYTGNFETFFFPSFVLFVGLELEGTYIELLDEVKQRLRNEGVEGAMDAI